MPRSVGSEAGGPGQSARAFLLVLASPPPSCELQRRVRHLYGDPRWRAIGATTLLVPEVKTASRSLALHC